MPLLVLGLSHHTAPVAVRERFAVAPARLPAVLAHVRDTGAADEAVILSTCNRVEIYAATALPAAGAFEALERCLLDPAGWGEPAEEPDPISPALSSVGGKAEVSRTVEGESGRFPAPGRDSDLVNALHEQLYRLTEPRSVEHLFRVACGLDSMVLGETEILGQLKAAYDLARQHGHTGRVLNKAFQCAFHVAKRVRSETCIQRGSVSVGSVAVELAERIFGALRAREVLVIGAGDTSEKTARALLSRGARRILVTNRSFERAEALARQLGGWAVPFDAWEAAFATVNIVISSTAAPHYILDRARLVPLMKRRQHEPLLLIDTAVPRDIEPEVNLLENVYLYNIDDLQAIADDSLRRRRAEVARCEAIIAEKARALLEARRPPLPPGLTDPATQP